MIMSYADILTEEQKEAFRKGDAYYKSSFKGMRTREALCSTSATSTGFAYVASSRSRIHDAMVDSWKSKSWN